MAKGYIIFTEKVNDQAAHGAYVEKAVPTILRQGGKVIVFDSDYAVLEGEWHGEQTVILEFESVEAAKAWYNSDEYQAIIGERHAAAENNAVIVSEFQMPAS